MDKKTQGKKNRASGAAFELRVRKNLEKKGWIVAKWTNTVEFYYKNMGEIDEDSSPTHGKLIPAKRKFNPFSKVMSIGTGFPDFIAFKRHDGWDTYANGCYEIKAVECKGGIKPYLDKEEKAKCTWLLKNNIFSKILIAKKGKKRGEIEYVEFKML